MDYEYGACCSEADSADSYKRQRGNQPSDIKSQCRKVKKDQGLGLITVDYLQLMQPHVRKNSR